MSFSAFTENYGDDSFYDSKETHTRYIEKFVRLKRSDSAEIIFESYSRLYFIVNYVILLFVVVHYKKAGSALFNKILSAVRMVFGCTMAN